MTNNQQKKTMMVTMASLATVALVALSFMGGQKVNLTHASNSYTETFNSATSRSLKTVQKTNKTVSPETNYGTITLQNHDTILAAGLQFPESTYGTSSCPTNALVEATIAANSTSVFGVAKYESAASLIIGLNNITSISVTAKHPSTSTINSLYIYFYDASFASLGNDLGSGKTSSVSGTDTIWTNTVTSPSGNAVRWAEIDFTVNAPTYVKNTIGATISAISVSWAC